MKPLGTVSLVGAGPGDPELLTERAVRRIERADVVLYDALVHPDVLRHCRADARVESVGKRAGHASARQERITASMIDAARAGKNVVRLKGGDPLVFSRGSEEAQALHAAGVPFEIVPGVASPMASAAYAGIPLTDRVLSSSVAFVTATESAEKDSSSHDWAKLATATQTLVIFMGLRKLDSLMALLASHGRDANTPAAVIEWASLPRQRVVVGTVGTIAELAAKANLGMPSLTIVGEAVRLRELLDWCSSRPLFGKRVLVTRPRDQTADLSRRLRDEGAEPVLAETIRTVVPSDTRPLTHAVRNLGTYGWVVFTSQNGVRFLFEELARQGGDARRFANARIAAIGPTTARSLEARGLRTDVQPDEYRGEAAAEAIIKAHGASLRGANILLPRASIARDVLPETLRAEGASVDVIAAYETVPASAETQAHIRALFDEEAIDVVTFTSSSTVENLVEVLGPKAAERLAALTVASIGPITTETAEKLGIRVDVTASVYTHEGLVDALRLHYKETTRS